MSFSFAPFGADTLGFIERFVVAPLWPFFAFVVLFPLAHSAWIFWRQQIYKHSIKWVLLELKVPREIKKGPRAMEQVLMAINQLRNTAKDLQEIYWDGEVTRWYCFELASFGGEIHFYIRCYAKQRNLVKGAFYSFYPDLEIEEVPDYVERFPANTRELYAQGYDVWGGEMKLAREDAYPIRTYPAFEAPAEEKEFDPMAAMLEMLGKIAKEEIVAIQFLAAPAAPSWRKEYEHLVGKLRETKTQKTEKTGTEGQLESFARFIARSPGETDVLKAVENNLSKQAFETTIRYLYLSPKTIFYDSIPRRVLKSVFNQYAALDLNYFEINYAVATRTKIWNWPFIFPRRRNEYRKMRMLFNYRHRELAPDVFMEKVLTSYFFDWNFKSRSYKMTTECLATVFHLPTYLTLTAPHVPRVESKKGGPPAGLAIFGDEKEVEQFQ